MCYLMTRLIYNYHATVGATLTIINSRESADRANQLNKKIKPEITGHHHAWVRDQVRFPAQELSLFSIIQLTYHSQQSLKKNERLRGQRTEDRPSRGEYSFLQQFYLHQDREATRSLSCDSIAPAADWPTWTNLSAVPSLIESRLIRPIDPNAWRRISDTIAPLNCSKIMVCTRTAITFESNQRESENFRLFPFERESSSLLRKVNIRSEGWAQTLKLHRFMHPSQ